MTSILRDPAGIADESFDVVVVGGGIYGAMLLFEATRAGLKTLLLERGDFGAATSANHFRIAHGGLRYLQSLDLGRFRESVLERRWLLRAFPTLVEPLRCVMPLYGEGLRRAAVLRAILKVNDGLSFDRNRGLDPDRALGGSRILGKRELLEAYPQLREAGLQGAALWYDATIRHSNRILIETLCRACARGARAQNYVEVTDVRRHGDAVTGVTAIDLETGVEVRYRSTAVINATGPWTRNFARRVDVDMPRLFRPSLAWNILFARPPLGQGALAVKPPAPGGQTYFLASRGGRLFAGTGHAPCGEADEGASPSPDLIAAFIRDLNEAIPGLELSDNDIVKVFSGYLPAQAGEPLRLSGRAVLIDHGRNGGAKNLYSIAGVKYTTARSTAERMIRCVCNGSFRGRMARKADLESGPNSCSEYRFTPFGDDWPRILKEMIGRESVVHLDDLVLRRTDLGDYPAQAVSLIDRLAGLFGWEEGRMNAEKRRLRLALDPRAAEC